MEVRYPYIEIVPFDCKEEEPTCDTMNLRGKFMSDSGYNIHLWITIVNTTSTNGWKNTAFESDKIESE